MIGWPLSNELGRAKKEEFTGSELGLRPVHYEPWLPYGGEWLASFSSRSVHGKVYGVSPELVWTEKSSSSLGIEPRYPWNLSRHHYAPWATLICAVMHRPAKVIFSQCGTLLWASQTGSSRDTPVRRRQQENTESWVWVLKRLDTGTTSSGRIEGA